MLDLNPFNGINLLLGIPRFFEGFEIWCTSRPYLAITMGVIGLLIVLLLINAILSIAWCAYIIVRIPWKLTSLCLRFTRYLIRLFPLTLFQKVHKTTSNNTHKRSSIPLRLLILFFICAINWSSLSWFITKF